MKKKAKEITENYLEKQKMTAVKSPVVKTTLENLLANASGDNKLKELKLIIKADTHGSVEAICGSLVKLNNEEVIIRIIHQGVGGITESDVMLAKASLAIIVAFNIRANSQVSLAAEKEAVQILYYNIIYNLIDEVKAIISGMLSPILREERLGTAEIRQVFNLTKYGKVAGCYIISGIIKRYSKVRIVRDNVVIYTGQLKALKRFKEDVKEVKEGFECGISVENYDDFRIGDQVETFEYRSIQNLT